MNDRRQHISPARFWAFKAIQQIEQHDSYANLVLAGIQKEVSLKDSDRALLNEIVKGTIRWKKRLDWIVDQIWQGKRNKLQKRIRWILWIGLYQIIFLKRIPISAAVNESVRLAKYVAGPSVAGIVNAVLRSYIRQPGRVVYPDEKKDPVAALAVRKSYPEWLVQLWIEQFGLEDTIALCDANNQPAHLCIRANRLKIDRAEFEAQLSERQIPFRPSLVPGFYLLESFAWRDIQDMLDRGWMTVQDESAGLPALALDPRPGDVVLDLCAAPGSKSTHIAELTDDKGRILAGDIKPARARLIKESARRLHFKSVHAVTADANATPMRMADKVLLDAPCSGLGVLRRKVDLRWRRQPQDLEDLAALQARLIRKAAKHVSKNGTLVYSTCTIEPIENDEIVQKFLKEHKNFKLVKISNINHLEKIVCDNHFIKTFPHVHHMDGSFVAKLVRVR